LKEPITWTDCKLRLGDLSEWDDNPAEITKDAGARLAESLGEFGQIQTLAIDPERRLVDGHQRRGVWIDKYGADYVVDCRMASRMLTQKERQKIAVLLRSGTTGRYNWDKLAAWEGDDLQAWGMDATTLQEWKTDVAALGNFLGSEIAEDMPEFKEYGEDTADGIEVCECSKCGHKHSAKKIDYLPFLESCWQEHLTPKPADAPTVISTFAGCGGSSLMFLYRRSQDIQGINRE
jgi:hypothetical protein